MSSKTLIILSKLYPYYPEFIQDEVSFIESCYDRVIVLACGKKADKQVNQPVGKNFIIFGRNEIQNKWLKYAVYIICGMLALPMDEIYKTEIKRSKGFRKKLAVLYTIGKVNEELKFAKEKLETVSFYDNEKIFIYSFWFTDTALLACQLKEQLGKDRTFAFTRAHGSDLYADRNLSKSLPFRTYCLEHLNEVYPCSENGAQYLISQYPQFAEKIFCKYLGVKNRGCSVFNANKNEFHIVSCSNIIPLKRIDIIADGLFELERRGIRNIVWTCFGGGDLLSSIKEKCNDLKYNKAVFKGPTKNEEIMRFYRESDIDLFVNVSNSEGLPVSIMEAMSFGIPVLATDVGGTNEIVIDGVTGLLINSNVDSLKFADYIEAFIKLDLETKLAMRGKARNLFCDKFDSAKNYREFHKNLSKKQL